jgi:hypothetical protein
MGLLNQPEIRQKSVFSQPQIRKKSVLNQRGGWRQTVSKFFLQLRKNAFFPFSLRSVFFLLKKKQPAAEKGKKGFFSFFAFSPQKNFF